MVRVNIGSGMPGSEPAKPDFFGIEPEPAKADDVDSSLNEIMCPLTGEVVSRDDVDGLIDLYESLKQKNDQAYAVLMEIRRTLASKTEGDAKTRRVAGRRRKAKVEMPSDSWEQSILKEAFNAFPQHRDTVLKIDTIGVKVREFKKLVNTSGPPDLETFRDMVSRANRGPTGTPTVTIEV